MSKGIDTRDGATVPIHPERTTCEDGARRSGEGMASVLVHLRDQQLQKDSVVPLSHPNDEPG